MSHQQSRGVSLANVLHSPAQNPRSFWLPAFYFPQGIPSCYLVARSSILKASKLHCRCCPKLIHVNLDYVSYIYQ